MESASSDPEYWLYKAEWGLAAATVAAFTVKVRTGEYPSSPPDVSNGMMLMDKISRLHDWSEEVVGATSIEGVIEEARRELEEQVG